ncbi:endonuclease/exonuclease/phosphatase family protein [Streptomyces sp. NPDC058319]|uniref:endonuclease/exonuclease/phosphatase family protein n=1 Tax=unclassified Streptomyces TaxID=2593676 RepID=UPI0036F0DE4C
MRRLVNTVAAFCVLISGLLLFSAGPASATAVSADADAVAKSAGQKWALRSLANRKYVSVRLHDADSKEWRLRASADQPGTWERFTLHTNHAGRTIGFRSEITGFFASAEFADGGDQKGMLRARGVRLGQWQQFIPHYLDDAVLPDSPRGSVVVTLQASEKAQNDGTATDAQKELKYVSAELGDDNDGELRARAASAGSWEKFVLEPVAGTLASDTHDMPAAGSAPASDLNVMTWNLCANNRSCAWSGGLAGYAELNSDISAHLRSGSGALPDVIFFQEFCEKHAKRVEEMLEKPVGEGGTGRQWDVRFAPIHNEGDANGPLIQKQCAIKDKNDNVVADRGAYGVAIAVPDENVWYKRYDLVSPTYNLKYEQRTAVCAVLPSRAVAACTAHLSAGYLYEDPDGTWRKRQAQQLLDITRTYEAKGYRVVFGGDFNLVPPYPQAGPKEGGPSEALDPVYDKYLECGQQGDPDAKRTGAPTANASGGKPTRKIDYIFAPKNAPVRNCSVSSGSGHSDHWTLYGTVSLPAT